MNKSKTVCSWLSALALSAGLCLVAASNGQAATAGSAAVDPPGGGKLVPKELGPENLDLDNGIEGTVSADRASQRLFTRSGCIQPNRAITYRFSLNGKGTFTFKTTPDRFFDVVMRVAIPGISGLPATIDCYFAGGAETLKVRKTVARSINGSVRISGFRNSGGCFNLRISP